MDTWEKEDDVPLKYLNDDVQEKREKKKLGKLLNANGLKTVGVPEEESFYKALAHQMEEDIEMVKKRIHDHTIQFKDHYSQVLYANIELQSAANLLQENVLVFKSTMQVVPVAPTLKVEGEKRLHKKVSKVMIAQLVLRNKELYDAVVTAANSNKFAISRADTEKPVAQRRYSGVTTDFQVDYTKVDDALAESSQTLDPQENGPSTQSSEESSNLDDASVKSSQTLDTHEYGPSTQGSDESSDLDDASARNSQCLDPQENRPSTQSSEESSNLNDTSVSSQTLDTYENGPSTQRSEESSNFSVDDASARNSQCLEPQENGPSSNFENASAKISQTQDPQANESSIQSSEESSNCTSTESSQTLEAQDTGPSSQSSGESPNYGTHSQIFLMPAATNYESAPDGLTGQILWMPCLQSAAGFEAWPPIPSYKNAQYGSMNVVYNDCFLNTAAMDSQKESCTSPDNNTAQKFLTLNLDHLHGNTKEVEIRNEENKEEGSLRNEENGNVEAQRNMENENLDAQRNDENEPGLDYSTAQEFLTLNLDHLYGNMEEVEIGNEEVEVRNEENMDEGEEENENVEAQKSDESENIDPQKKSRKRYRNPDEWIKNKRKKLRNKGQQYISSSGKMVQARQFSDVQCNHKKKGTYDCETIPEQERRAIFHQYWDLGDVDLQREFIRNCVENGPTKSRSLLAKENRDIARKYFFVINNERKRVCQDMFKRTLSVSKTVISTTMKKINDLGFLETERRGKVTPPNKLSDEQTNEVKAHIERFPTMESHYCRASSKRQYLPSDLNLKRMYQHYTENAQHASVSEVIYRTIFNHDYNLGFHRPKKDLCSTCDSFSKKENPTEEEKQAQKQHQDKKDRARQEKTRDVEWSNGNQNERRVITFDLQSVLYTPSSNVSTMYYTRKMCVYNLTVYESLSKRGMCFLWDECNGKRGSCEIGTCLFKYSQCTTSTDIVMFSDACAGQNRNRYTAMALLYSVKKSQVKQITHKFLTSGHTDMEVDSVHSTIERRAKNVEIHVPTDWYSVIRLARHRQPYDVIPLTFDDFLDFKAGTEPIKYDTDGLPVRWSELVYLRVNKDSPNAFYVKYGFDEQERKIVLKKKSMEVPALYTKKLPMSIKKKKDLMKLCKNDTIPEVYHAFYKSLPAVNCADKLGEPDAEESDVDSD